MTLPPNSAQARDVAYLLHPATNTRRHERTGPIVMARGSGIHVYDDAGKEDIEAWRGCGASRSASERRGWSRPPPAR